jgi:hypothetical protein
MIPKIQTILSDSDFSDSLGEIKRWRRLRQNLAHHQTRDFGKAKTLGT